MNQIITFANVSAQRRNIQALQELISMIGTSRPKPVQVVPIVVFMAFSIEAYVNSLGSQHIPNWEKCERKSWKDKIKILHKKKKKPASWNSGPLAFATDIFDIRDRLAHGKPERVEGPSFDSMKEAEDYITSSDFDPSWFSTLDSEWYEKSQAKFFELLGYLALVCNLSPTDYLNAATAYVTQV